MPRIQPESELLKPQEQAELHPELNPELMRDRVFLLLLAGIYISWAGIYDWMGIPQTRADVVGRLWVSGLSIFFFTLSFFSDRLARHLYLPTAFCFCLCTAHYFYLTAEHLSNPTYVIGAYITVFAIGSYFQTRAGIRSYLLFFVFLSCFMPNSNEAVYPKLLFVSGMMTSGFVFYYASSARFQLMDHERKSRERITELFDQLKIEQARLQEGQEIAKVGNWEWTPGTSEVFWSDELFRIYELPNLAANQISLESYLSRLHPDDTSHIHSAIEQAVNERQSYSFEHRIILNDGRIKWILAKGRPVLNEAGEVKTLRGVGQDITEQKKAKELLAREQAKSMTSAKMAGLGQMAGGVAHEINNPLTIIYGKAEQLVWLARKSALSAEMVEDAAEKIKVTVVRISKIVKSLRAFSREGSQDPFQLTEISSIIQDTVELCREKLRHHGVELRMVEQSPGERKVECRPVEISQVLLNLLNNSFDAVAPLQEKWIEISVAETDSELFIQMTDSGSGIPKPVQSRLFEPFYTTKEVGKGTGLGLSVSKGILESHGGSLKLEPDSDHTRFVIRLPLRQTVS